MLEPALDPRPTGGVLFAEEREGVSLRFCGRRLQAPLEQLPALLAPAPDAVAHLTQIHSARVQRASAGGRCGEGDALLTTESGLAAAVYTADCVPVLLAADGEVAAVHAGWRGLAAGVIPAAAASLGRRPLRAWIGPAIGPCCYEVSPEVASAVEAASSPQVAVWQPGGRPHLDLWAAAQAQLARHGIEVVATLRWCTRCHGDHLWSFRRDGQAAGRNYSLIWRR
jgi:YfiH family protein